jgi:hypothetical protein
MQIQTVNLHELDARNFKSHIPPERLRRKNDHWSSCTHHAIVQQMTAMIPHPGQTIGLTGHDDHAAIDVDSS